MMIENLQEAQILLQIFDAAVKNPTDGGLKLVKPIAVFADRLEKHIQELNKPVEPPPPLVEKENVVMRDQPI